MRSERRLHPLSFLFTVGSSVFGFLLPLFAAWLAARSTGVDVVFGLWLVPFGLWAMFRYITYRYEFGEKDLRIRTGFVFRRERRIPYARIHNVATVRNVFHRLFGVAEVVLETAGGEETEAKLQVLSLEAVEELKTFLDRARDSSDAETAGPEAPTEARPADGEILRLRPRDLVLLGLLENRGLIVVGAILGLLWELDWWGLDEVSFERLFAEGVGAAGEVVGPTLDLPLLVVLALAIFLVLVRLFSVAWSLLTLWGFRLERRGALIGTEAGLLKRVATAVPIHRVQVVTVRQGPLFGLFGRVEIRVEVAGGGGGEESDENAARPVRLVPLAPEGAVPRLLSGIFPGAKVEGASWTPVHPRARRRILTESLFVLLAIAIFPTTGAVVSGHRVVAAMLLFLSIVLVGVAALNAARQSRAFLYAEEEDLFRFRSGWLWRRTSLVRGSKIQNVTLTESPFDRRHGMASIRVDTAGAGPAGHPLEIPYLPAESAVRLLERLGEHASRTRFRW